MDRDSPHHRWSPNSHSLGYRWQRTSSCRSLNRRSDAAGMNVENNFFAGVFIARTVADRESGKHNSNQTYTWELFHGRNSFLFFYLCQFDICQTNSNDMPHSGLALSPKALAADFCKSPGSGNSGRQIGIPYTLPVWREYLPAGWCAPFSAEIDQ